MRRNSRGNLTVLSLVLAIAGLAPHAARAGIIGTYTDQAGFVTATGAGSITGPIPNLGNVGTGPIAVGDVTLDSLSGSLFLGSAGVSASLDVDGWSTLIPGHDIAVSGTEDFEVGVTVGGPVSSLGFFMHEPTAAAGLQPDSCNFGTCPDSTFALSLYRGASLVDSIAFNAPDDELAFFGVTSDMAFDRVTLIETTGNADNEYFGEFYATRVPLPGTLALFALGLLGVAAVRHRDG